MIKTMLFLVLSTILIISISPLSALKCHFFIDSNKNYNCELSNAAPNEHIFIHNITGYDDLNVTILSTAIDENSSLPVLDSTLMTKFINLRKFEINFFHIKEVTADAFNSCENIKEISLNYNNLSYLPSAVFRNCNNLKILKLSSNSFKTLPVDGFDGLSQLEVLKIDNNPIVKVMSDDFKFLTTLKELYLSDTELNSFNISSIPTIEVLDIRKNKFINFEVSNASKLHSLNISRNNLRTLRFSGPSNLKELDLSMNSLSDLPVDTFSSLTSLNVLKLSWNSQIYRNLSRSFFHGLENLKFLELKSCDITELTTATFVMLDSLQELDVSHNNIQELPYIITFKNPGHLMTFKASSNSIKHVKSTTFIRLTSLIVLDLSHNSIKDIEHAAFKYLKKLVKLNLAANLIDVLEIDMFPENLLELDVSYNKIKAVEAGFGTNLMIIMTDNPCMEVTMDICYKNFEELKIETTTELETTTIGINEELEFSLKDLLFTIICILFIAVMLIIAVFYINGILNFFGIYEKPIVKDDNAGTVTYQRF